MDNLVSSLNRFKDKNLPIIFISNYYGCDVIIPPELLNLTLTSHIPNIGHTHDIYETSKLNTIHDLMKIVNNQGNLTCYSFGSYVLLEIKKVTYDKEYAGLFLTKQY